MSNAQPEQNAQNVTRLLILFKILLMEYVTVWILTTNSLKLNHVYYVQHRLLIVSHVLILQLLLVMLVKMIMYLIHKEQNVNKKMD